MCCNDNQVVVEPNIVHGRIEAGLATVSARWLGVVPAAARVPLVLRDPTIDCDATEPKQYTSIRYSQRLLDAGALASIGTAIRMTTLRPRA